ncbi:MAG: flagellar basal body rod protein FlgB [bacterium]|nr:flagellar basal body rod protein FlgB [bacterium]
MKIFDSTLDALETKLSLHSRRHALLSSNVANNDTPGFRARELDFAGELQQALGEGKEDLIRTNSRHLDVDMPGDSHVVMDYSGAMGNDGNNIDLDIEMGKLGDNAREYNKAATYVSMKLRMLRMAASGSGGV